jgi:hypothetical protein
MSNTVIGVTLALFSLAASPAPLVEIRNANDPDRRIEARAALDTDEVRLSAEIKLTLSVEAPGPLTVTPPRPLLAKSNLWRVREDGMPLREVSGKREKWTQVYRLSPLVPGKPEIAPGPLTLRAGGGQDVTIDWADKSITVEVRTSIESPSIESLRPPTDIEQLPPPPSIEPQSSPWLFAIVPALLVLAAVGVYFGRRKRIPLVPHDAAWALGELANPDLTADHCAHILRQFLSYHFGLPAEGRTNPELVVALRSEDRLSPEAAAEWQALLDDCDIVRFSGTAMDVAPLADRARMLVRSAQLAEANRPPETTGRVK